ncbi:MAG: ABC transporter permease [Deltaproteobacteria bacterium]|nr:ABC transporter permease [Deltaproteobacteria bacterium]
MAWRNIWRNRRRTFLTMTAIAFAGALLVFMLSFQFGSYEVMINSAVKIHTGHLQVQAEGYNERKDIRLVVPDPEAVAAVLEKTPGIEAYTFRATTFSLVSSRDRTYGIAVIGIDPKGEARVSTISDIIREGEYFSDDATSQALVGELLARNLHVRPGDELTLLGQGRDGSIAATVVAVKGVYRSGQDEFDRGALQIPLALFQDVFAMGEAVHEVVALCTSLGAVPEAKGTLSAALTRLNENRPLVALDWKELMPGLYQGISIDLISGLIMYVLLIVVVAFSILNTFLMAIFERTREFGVMMAMGTTPGRLTKLLLMESSMITIFGIVGGMIVGGLVTWYFQVDGINLGGDVSEIMREFGISGRLYPQLSLLSLSFGPGAVLIITLLTSLYPALRVRRFRPVEALTYV